MNVYQVRAYDQWVTREIRADTPQEAALYFAKTYCEEFQSPYKIRVCMMSNTVNQGLQMWDFMIKLEVVAEITQ
jgi:hypothetical protein